MKKLSKKEFYETFIEDFLKSEKIKKYQNIKFYWNGAVAESNGYPVRQGSTGGCYHRKYDNSIVVVRFRENQKDTLGVFLHEIAHATMHNKSTLCDDAMEIEAESVVREVFNKLGIDYKKDDYIEFYKDKYNKSHRKPYTMTVDRKFLLNLIVEIFVELLKDKKDIINELVSEEPVKYKIICPHCKQVWEYQKMCKIIKVKGKGYYCQQCGLDTKDTLIFETM